MKKTQKTNRLNIEFEWCNWFLPFICMNSSTETYPKQQIFGEQNSIALPRNTVFYFFKSIFNKLHASKYRITA